MQFLMPPTCGLRYMISLNRVLFYSQNYEHKYDIASVVQIRVILRIIMKFSVQWPLNHML